MQKWFGLLWVCVGWLICRLPGWCGSLLLLTTFSAFVWLGGGYSAHYGRSVRSLVIRCMWFVFGSSSAWAEFTSAWAESVLCTSAWADGLCCFILRGLIYYGKWDLLSSVWLHIVLVGLVIISWIWSYLLLWWSWRKWMIHGDCTWRWISKMCFGRRNVLCNPSYRLQVWNMLPLVVGSTSPKFGQWWGILMMVFMVVQSRIGVQSMQWDWKKRFETRWRWWTGRIGVDSYENSLEYQLCVNPCLNNCLLI